MNGQNGDLRSSSHFTYRGHRLGAVVATIALVLVPLAFALLFDWKQTSSPPTGRSLEQTSHTLELINDTEFDADFEVFVFGDHDETLETLGRIDSGDSAIVTVPADIESSYVFYLTAEVGEDTAYLNSSVTEEGLEDLDYEYRFIQDDMGVRAVDPEDWPTPQYSPTPWDLTAVPTSTDEPND